MAEGHAVVRQALRLQPLVGHPLVDVQMPRRWGDRPAGLVGQCIVAVRPRGKHLLLPLAPPSPSGVSGGGGPEPALTLHTHGAQYGSWQIGERPPDGGPIAYRKPERAIRLRLVTHAHEAVFYWGPTVELLTPDELAAHERLNALGPDIMGTTDALTPGGAFDADEATRRVRAQAGVPVGSAIQDQRAVAGIGNIYAAEGLFLAGVSPLRDAAAVGADELARLWSVLPPLMWDGTTRYGPTVTVPPERRAAGETRWVYGRKGKPCLVCGTAVEKHALPPFGRATYRCPVCQPDAPGASSADGP